MYIFILLVHLLTAEGIAVSEVPSFSEEVIARNWKDSPQCESLYNYCVNIATTMDDYKACVPKFDIKCGKPKVSSTTQPWRYTTNEVTSTKYNAISSSTNSNPLTTSEALSSTYVLNDYRSSPSHETTRLFEMASSENSDNNVATTTPSTKLSASTNEKQLSSGTQMSDKIMSSPSSVQLKSSADFSPSPMANTKSTEINSFVESAISTDITDPNLMDTSPSATSPLKIVSTSFAMKDDHSTNPSFSQLFMTTNNYKSSVPSDLSSANGIKVDTVPSTYSSITFSSDSAYSVPSTPIGNSFSTTTAELLASSSTSTSNDDAAADKDTTTFKATSTFISSDSSSLPSFGDSSAASTNKFPLYSLTSVEQPLTKLETQIKTTTLKPDPSSLSKLTSSVSIESSTSMATTNEVTSMSPISTASNRDATTNVLIISSTMPTFAAEASTFDLKPSMSSALISSTKNLGNSHGHSASSSIITSSPSSLSSSGFDISSPAKLDLSTVVEKMDTILTQPTATISREISPFDSASSRTSFPSTEKVVTTMPQTLPSTTLNAAEQTHSINNDQSSASPLNEKSSPSTFDSLTSISSDAPNEREDSETSPSTLFGGNSTEILTSDSIEKFSPSTGANEKASLGSLANTNEIFMATSSPQAEHFKGSTVPSSTEYSRASESTLFQNKKSSHARDSTVQTFPSSQSFPVSSVTLSANSKLNNNNEYATTMIPTSSESNEISSETPIKRSPGSSTQSFSSLESSQNADYTQTTNILGSSPIQVKTSEKDLETLSTKIYSTKTHEEGNHNIEANSDSQDTSTNAASSTDLTNALTQTEKTPIVSTSIGADLNEDAKTTNKIIMQTSMEENKKSSEKIFSASITVFDKAFSTEGVTKGKSSDSEITSLANVKTDSYSTANPKSDLASSNTFINQESTATGSDVDNGVTSTSILPYVSTNVNNQLSTDKKFISEKDLKSSISSLPMSSTQKVFTDNLIDDDKTMITAGTTQQNLMESSTVVTSTVFEETKKTSLDEIIESSPATVPKEVLTLDATDTSSGVEDVAETTASTSLISSEGSKTFYSKKQTVPTVDNSESSEIDSANQFSSTTKIISSQGGTTSVLNMESKATISDANDFINSQGSSAPSHEIHDVSTISASSNDINKMSSNKPETTITNKDSEITTPEGNSKSTVGISTDLKQINSEYPMESKSSDASTSVTNQIQTDSTPMSTEKLNVPSSSTGKFISSQSSLNNAPDNTAATTDDIVEFQKSSQITKNSIIPASGESKQTNFKNGELTKTSIDPIDMSSNSIKYDSSSSKIVNNKKTSPVTTLNAAYKTESGYDETQSSVSPGTDKENSDVIKSSTVYSASTTAAIQGSQSTQSFEGTSQQVHSSTNEENYIEQKSSTGSENKEAMSSTADSTVINFNDNSASMPMDTTQKTALTSGQSSNSKFATMDSNNLIKSTDGSQTPDVVEFSLTSNSPSPKMATFVNDATTTVSQSLSSKDHSSIKSVEHASLRTSPIMTPITTSTSSQQSLNDATTNAAHSIVNTESSKVTDEPISDNVNEYPSSSKAFEMTVNPSSVQIHQTTVIEDGGASKLGEQENTHSGSESTKEPQGGDEQSSVAPTKSGNAKSESSSLDMQTNSVTTKSTSTSQDNADTIDSHSTKSTGSDNTKNPTIADAPATPPPASETPKEQQQQQPTPSGTKPPPPAFPIRFTSKLLNQRYNQFWENFWFLAAIFLVIAIIVYHVLFSWFYLRAIRPKIKLVICIALFGFSFWLGFVIIHYKIMLPYRLYSNWRDYL